MNLMEGMSKSQWCYKWTVVDVSNEPFQSLSALLLISTAAGTTISINRKQYDFNWQSQERFVFERVNYRRVMLDQCNWETINKFILHSPPWENSSEMHSRRLLRSPDRIKHHRLIVEPRSIIIHPCVGFLSFYVFHLFLIPTIRNRFPKWTVCS